MRRLWTTDLVYQRHFCKWYNNGLHYTLLSLSFLLSFCLLENIVQHLTFLPFLFLFVKCIAHILNLSCLGFPLILSLMKYNNNKGRYLSLSLSLSIPLSFTRSLSLSLFYLFLTFSLSSPSLSHTLSSRYKAEVHRYARSTNLSWSWLVTFFMSLFKSMYMFNQTG